MVAFDAFVKNPNFKNQKLFIYTNRKAFFLFQRLLTDGMDTGPCRKTQTLLRAGIYTFYSADALRRTGNLLHGKRRKCLSANTQLGGLTN